MGEVRGETGENRLLLAMLSFRASEEPARTIKAGLPERSRRACPNIYGRACPTSIQAGLPEHLWAGLPERNGREISCFYNEKILHFVSLHSE